MQDAISSGNITPSVINAYEYYYEVPYVPSSEPAPSTPSVSTYNKPVTSGSKDLTTEGARKEKLSSQTKKAKKTSPTQAILDQAAVIENLYNSGRLTEEQANSMLDAIGIPR
jgi:hypothetical protein